MEDAKNFILTGHTGLDDNLACIISFMFPFSPLLKLACIRKDTLCVLLSCKAFGPWPAQHSFKIQMILAMYGSSTRVGITSSTAT
jgi:hypothetical protein